MEGTLHTASISKWPFPFVSTLVANIVQRVSARFVGMPTLTSTYILTNIVRRSKGIFWCFVGVRESQPTWGQQYKVTLCTLSTSPCPRFKIRSGRYPGIPEGASLSLVSSTILICVMLLCRPINYSFFIFYYFLQNGSVL
jgi:hypothetical protein